MHQRARDRLAAWSAANPVDLEPLRCVGFEATYEQVHDGVFAGRPFPDGWWNRLSEAVERRVATARRAGLVVVPPNSMNRYGAIVDDLGFRPLMAQLVRELVEPVAKRLYPEVASCGLDGHHAFTVDYSPETDDHLSWHVDDSEVTLNLCLGDDFDGGDLLFRGRRCLWHRDRPWHDDELFQVAHTPGTAILHVGKHRHEALPVTRGYRRNLIIWCMSGCYRERTGNRCPEWCPEHRPVER